MPIYAGRLWQKTIIANLTKERKIQEQKHTYCVKSIGPWLGPYILYNRVDTGLRRWLDFMKPGTFAPEANICES